MDLDNTHLMSLLNITGVIFKCLFHKKKLTAVPSVARTNVVSVNIQHRVSSSQFQHRADHVSPPVLWHTENNIVSNYLLVCFSTLAPLPKHRLYGNMDLHFLEHLRNLT